MITRVVKIIILFVSIFFTHAQDTDLQSWHNFELGYKPISNLSLTLNNGVRFVEDVSEVSRCFIDFNIKRKHSKFLSYSLGYRHLFDVSGGDDATYIHRKERWYLDAYLKQTILILRLIYVKLVNSMVKQVQWLLVGIIILDHVFEQKRVKPEDILLNFGWLSQK